MAANVADSKQTPAGAAPTILRIKRRLDQVPLATLDFGAFPVFN